MFVRLVFVAAVVVVRFIITACVSVLVGMVGLSGLPPEHMRVQQVISLLTGQVATEEEVKEVSGLPPEHKRV